MFGSDTPNSDRSTYVPVCSGSMRISVSDLKPSCLNVTGVLHRLGSRSGLGQLLQYSSDQCEDSGRLRTENGGQRLS